MTDKADILVGMFHDLRDDCEHYKGIKEDDEDQCVHPDKRGEWCSFKECPLIAMAINKHGLN